MIRRILSSLPLTICLTSALGCSVQTGPSESTDTVAELVTACPKASASDDQMRAAATVAYRLMRGEADQAYRMNMASTSILSSQRYILQSKGLGIEFDPKDPLYPYVTSQMIADLAFAQLDASVAKFLSDGLKAAYAASDGSRFPHMMALPALAGFSFRTTTTHHIKDLESANDSHTATVTSRAWCGTEIVTIAERVEQSRHFAPLHFSDIEAWRKTRPPQFHGPSTDDSMTPFNGSTGANPYLVVTVNGRVDSWYNHPFEDCSNNPGFVCTGTIEIDPIPYAEPGAYYTVNQDLVGTQSNPFALVGTVLYAAPDHAGQWATRVTNGTTEWGTFSIPVTLFGTTKYKYTKKY